MQGSLSRPAFVSIEVPRGRATIFQVPGSSSINTLDVEAASGTIDVLMLNKRRWRQWRTCRKDLSARHIPCRDEKSFRARLHHTAGQRVLLVGRSRVNRNASAAVRICITGEHADLAREKGVKVCVLEVLLLALQQFRL